MPAPGFLPHAAFTCLIDGLTQGGYRCTGPQVRDEPIACTRLPDMRALPRSGTLAVRRAITPSRRSKTLPGPVVRRRSSRPCLLRANACGAQRMTPAALAVRGGDARAACPAGTDTTKEVAAPCTPPV